MCKADFALALLLLLLSLFLFFLLLLFMYDCPFIILVHACTQVPHNKDPFFRIPVFNYEEGYFACNFSANYYYGSQRHPQVRHQNVTITFSRSHFEDVLFVHDKKE